METLKALCIATIILIVPTTGNTQDFSKTIEGFQNSYLHEASGNLTEAILDLKNIYDENSYEINLRLGWLTYSLGQFSESQGYYSKAIELKTFAIEPRFGIVLPQAAMGNWTSVISQYEKILEITPNNSIAMHRLGLIYYGQKDYLKAEKYFEKVVNLYPFDYDGLVMYAWTNYQLKKYRQAKVLFNKALMNTPTGSSAMEGIKLMGDSK
jgi:tetratricopeptide (TPR) repeat protein